LLRRFLTVGEGARLARVSRSHLWKLVQRGEVQAIRVSTTGGPLRIPTEPFLAWLYGTQTPEALPPVTHSDLEPWVETEVVDAA
jgi:excisionase family DNA binding protein